MGGPGLTWRVTSSATQLGWVVMSTSPQATLKACPENITVPVGTPFSVSDAVFWPGVTLNVRVAEREGAVAMSSMQETPLGALKRASTRASVTKDLEGYRVLMAANGKEALDILDREHPSVILLDLMMPVMDGWQFVAELEHRGWRDVPLLILSADRSVQGHAKQLHASAHLAKPFDLDELLGKVQQLTGGALAN